MKNRYKGWAYTPKVPQVAITPAWRTSVSFKEGVQYLTFGNGRSYGDSCLNSSGLLIDSRYQNNIIDFDAETGTITCESGVRFAEIISLCVKYGWFLPVSPGTRNVTVGGAIANDVHGKNHHKSGTFGLHVIEMEIIRTDGSSTCCSSLKNSELFNATIGGLGLTGFIAWAKFSLIPINSSFMDVESIPFGNLDEFYDISAINGEVFDYSVAWLDCACIGNGFGRGVFFGANHNKSENTSLQKHNVAEPYLSFPFYAPTSMLNPIFVKSFNSAYYFKKRLTAGKSTEEICKYFYPLDNLRNWNRLYGRRGFFQYQFVVPKECTTHLQSILEIITQSGSASFLAVLKEFGSIESPGLLSFPRPGYCLALDFPHKGDKTKAMIARLDEIVRCAGGAVYPAKDRLMTGESFRQYFPNFDQFVTMIDPGMSSDFWERVR